MPPADPAQMSSSSSYYQWPADASDASDLTRQLGYYGYQIEAFADFDDLLTASERQPPQGMLLSCEGLATLTEAARTRLRELASAIPLIGISDDGGIAARLAAVRMGCRAYFTRPCDTASLLDALDRIAAVEERAVGRILVIDDSAAMAGLHAAYLKDAGFLCDIVTDPFRALDVLEESPPELILLDMHMPGANGEEVAKVIRQQDRYLSIPIVFLSAEQDVSRQREAMSLGGDEFLEKPIQPAHLISAVRSRIVRYRALRSRMVCDSLTGLLNHSTFKERLEAEVRRSRRRGGALSMAILDIDHFKLVNDTYGHPAGDRVIKSLARLLRQRLRGSELVARYGGEEFAVGLPEAPLEDAMRKLDEIRERFAAIEHHAGQQTFRVTLSAGVAQSGAQGQGDVLIQAADEALYEAKHGGRNQVRGRAG
ncbi:MAG: diguanylate cyclase [Betaproteobacteria bacterium]|nr:diguanylate cyclase [Betaproteobacteria bacterium]